MSDDEQLERMLRVRPQADAAYQAGIAELLDLPARERPIVGAPRLRAGGGGSRRSVIVFAIIAILIALLGAFTAGSLRNAVLIPVQTSLPTANPSPPVDFPAAALQDLTARWTDARQPGTLPLAAAVAIMRDGRIWGATGGYLHSGIVRLGASGRLYLVAVALQLVDEGRLALDGRIDRYIPAWPAARAVTVRQLMDGSSGLASFADPVDALARSVAADPKRVWTAADALAIAAAKRPRFAPGTRHDPADTDDALLDAIIETITGAPSSDAITTRILLPVALEKTFVAGAPIADPPGLLPYGAMATEMQSGLWDPNGTGTLTQVTDLPAGVLAVLGPARGMASNQWDLARGADAILLNPSLLSDSRRGDLSRSIEEGGFGGSEICPCDGVTPRGIGQIGHVGPYTSLLVYVPSERMTIGIVANMAVADGDLEALLQQVYDLVVPAFR